MRRCVILDRDGTVIVDRHYLSDPAGVELIPGAGAALRRLGELGLALVIVTNQSAVGRGYFDAARLEQIHGRLRQLLAAAGARLDGIYVCPHVEADDCRCRKPRPGLVERAAADLGFVPGESFVVGDKACDVELGKAIAATTILVRTGYGAEVAAGAGGAGADYVVDDLPAAARIIATLCSADKKD